jgi:catechol 2,3-dioxygenase-like lactoylglutathione lyase family enzyme
VYEPYFHVGILVRDIEAARADFCAFLGVEFEPVSSVQVATGETTRFCYSLQGPPYLELMEMTGTGSWSPEQGEGVHHLGLSDPSVPGRCAAFGNRTELISAAEDGTPRVVFTRPEALHGVRLEYFDAKLAAWMTEHLRSRAAASLHFGRRGPAGHLADVLLVPGRGGLPGFGAEVSALDSRAADSDYE